jgi:hypothetical protein
MKLNEEQHGEVLQLLSEVTRIVQQIAVCAEASCIGMDGLMCEMDARMTALRRILSQLGESERTATLVVTAGDGGDSGLLEPVIHEKMKELDTALNISTKVLRERLMEVETELKSARQSKRALNAYSSNT